MVLDLAGIELSGKGKTKPLPYCFGGKIVLLGHWLSLLATSLNEGEEVPDRQNNFCLLKASHKSVLFTLTLNKDVQRITSPSIFQFLTEPPIPPFILLSVYT